MAILKDLIVHGVSRFLGAIYGEKFVKTGGTSSLFLKADGSTDSNTYLTAETDPTVPSWAKQSSKPSYTASEVGAYTETQVNNLLANKEDKVVSLDIGFGQAITTDGIDISEYNKIVSAGAAENKPLLRDADGSILHVVAGDNTGEYKLMGFDDYGYVRIVTVGPGVMGSDYEILDVQSMPIEQFTESDPTVPSYVKSITQANITAWNGKQAALVSGTNIKTVNSTSLLGSGNLEVGQVPLEVFALYGGKVKKVDLESIISNFTSKQCFISFNGTRHEVIARSYDANNRYMIVASADSNGIRYGFMTWAYSDNDNTEVSVSWSRCYSTTEADTLLTTKQDTLVSGTNIKTVNNNSLVGSGNVLVGDITGEDVENTIVDLLTSLISDALRKSLQQLTLTEKSQVLNNLGISNVVTSNNLKTINGSSILGSGNLEVTVVDGGDINVAQSIGTSTTYVMSLKAVSELVERLDFNTTFSTTSLLKEILAANGWEIGKIFTNTGTFTNNANYCISPLIPYSGMRNVSITINRGGNLNTYPFTTYADNGTTRKYSYTTNLTIVNTTNGDASYDTAYYIRLCFNLEHLRECYILNNNTGLYILKMDDYIKELIDENSYLVDQKALDQLVSQELGNSTVKTMSLEAVRRELNIATNTSNITFLRGRLANFKIADYPEFDPRIADGISIVFACDYFASTKFPIFAIIDPSTTNEGFSVKHFALWNNWQNLTFGFATNYGGTLLDGGYNFGNLASLKHCVITYDFKTGISKLYKNGTLVSTKTPSTYDYQSTLNYFSNCTHIFMSVFSYSTLAKSNGIAVFGRVLTDADVQSIYGSGNSSIKSNLINYTWNANNLHPLKLTDWNIIINTGTKTAAEGGGYILTANSSGTNGLLLFGFNGINGVINNCIYDWDFEIIEGTGTHIGGLQSRKMLYGGQYHSCFVVTDSNGNDVTTSDWVPGEVYHVVCLPNNVSRNTANAESLLYLYYLFGTLGYKMKIYPILKMTEKGSALLYTINNYKGEYFLQPNGIKMPVNVKYYYNTDVFSVGRSYYVEDTVIGTSSTPNFNGQIAVDTTNGKIYVGYLTGTGGTWKQINNS